MYDALLHRRIDRDLSFNPLAVEERTTFAQQILPRVSNGDGVGKTFQRGLDIGTLSGFYPAFFRFLGIKSYALNILREALTYTRDRSTYPLQESSPLQADARALPVKSNSIDILTMMTGTFSHILAGSHTLVLDELARVISPLGIVVISDWNMGAAGQDFCGWYQEEQRRYLRDNHYPLTALKGGLEQRFFSSIIGYFTCTTTLVHDRWN